MRRVVGIVVGAVVGLVLVAGCAGPASHPATNPGPTTPRVTPASSVASSAVRSVPSSHAATPIATARRSVGARPLRSWASHVITGSRSGGFSTDSLIATGGQVYVLDGAAVERIAPKTGVMTAHALFDGQPGGPLALVGNQIWLPVVEPGKYAVLRFNSSLKPLPAVTVTVTVATGEPRAFYSTAVARSPGRFYYLTDGQHLFSINTRTDTPRRLPTTVSGSIAALATPAGSHPGVIATVRSSSGRGGGQVDTLSPDGHLLRVVRRFRAPGAGSRPVGIENPSAGSGALAATSTGIWIESSTGMASTFEFIRPGSAAGPPAYGVPSPSTMTVTGATSWLGLLGVLSCISSTTGKKLASTHVDGSESAIGAVAADRGRRYALWSAAGKVSLIQFTPPTGCSGT